MEKPEWERVVPVLSTAHIKPDTMSRLEPGGDKWGAVSVIAPYDYGWFVLLGTLDPETVQRLPDELKPVRKWFEATYPEQHWVAFDQDGDVLDALPVYEW